MGQPPSGCDVSAKQTRTEACACTLRVQLSCSTDVTTVKPVRASCLPHAHACKRQALLHAVGLTRAEPLAESKVKSGANNHLQKAKTFPNQVITTPNRYQSMLKWVHSLAITVPSALSEELPHMDAAEDGRPEQPAESPEGNAEAAPKRCPRSRVRADGTRRRTRAEIEARRKAKREGTGYWAGKGGGDNPSRRPASGPRTARSSSRATKKKTTMTGLGDATTTGGNPAHIPMMSEAGGRAQTGKQTSPMTRTRPGSQTSAQLGIGS